MAKELSSEQITKLIESLRMNLYGPVCSAVSPERRIEMLEEDIGELIGFAELANDGVSTEDYEDVKDSLAGYSRDLEGLLTACDAFLGECKTLGDLHVVTPEAIRIFTRAVRSARDGE